MIRRGILIELPLRNLRFTVSRSESYCDLQRGVFEPFERRRRVFTPSSAAFAESGRVLAAVAAREGWRLLDDQPSLPNDALIAASCREQGITLITKDGDFKRLARFVKGFRYAAP
jgi:predicted nucleic acid-binding protein